MSQNEQFSWPAREAVYRLSRTQVVAHLVVLSSLRMLSLPTWLELGCGCWHHPDVPEREQAWSRVFPVLLRTDAGDTRSFCPHSAAESSSQPHVAAREAEALGI